REAEAAPVAAGFSLLEPRSPEPRRSLPYSVLRCLEVQKRFGKLALGPRRPRPESALIPRGSTFAPGSHPRLRSRVPPYLRQCPPVRPAGRCDPTCASEASLRIR